MAAGSAERAPESRAGRKQGQARRDELREQVLAVIERRLRAGESFADLNVADIAGEAGISRSTFYAYFVDKTNVLGTWYLEFSRDLRSAAEQWWALDGSATRADLRVALGHVMAAYQAQPELLAATHDAIGLDEGVRSAVSDTMQRYIDATREHIEAGQRDGYVDPTLPAAETAYWLQWMAERALHMLTRRPGGDLSRMLDAHTAIVWNTLYAPTRR